MTDRLAPSSRHVFQHEGQKVYEWDQTLQDVNIYIDAPPGIRAKQLVVTVAATHLTVSIAGNPPYLNHDFGGRVKPSESFWTLEDGVLNILLCKADKGEPWKSALAGHAIDPFQQEEEVKRLMLERFQGEHPGFDFSGAEFSGSAPDPRSFQGGMPSDL